jgi:hypothetical protein
MTRDFLEECYNRNIPRSSRLGSGGPALIVGPDLKPLAARGLTQLLLRFRSRQTPWRRCTSLLPFVFISFRNKYKCKHWFIGCTCAVWATDVKGCSLDLTSGVLYALQNCMYDWARPNFVILSIFSRDSSRIFRDVLRPLRTGSTGKLLCPGKRPLG